MKRVAILQSNYIPWKGYFDIIRSVDCFIFYDDVQFTKNDWRNRNRIKTPQGTRWLSIPCGTNLKRLINEVRIDPDAWQTKHYQLLEQNYNTAPYWSVYKPFLENIFLERKWEFLSELNQQVIKQISCEILGCDTTFDASEEYALQTRREDRVLELLDKVGASHYLSGPAAKSYLDEAHFVERGITLEYIDYSQYPEYSQLFPPFDHAVSIIDLLLNEGPNATNFMLPVKE